MFEEPRDLFSQLNQHTTTALLAAGWHPGRRVDVSADVETLAAQGYEPSPVATAFLEALQGLKIGPAREDGPNFINGEPLLVDALGIGRRHRREALDMTAALGGSWFPVGWWLSYSHVYMGSDGTMTANADDVIWGLGSTPSMALDLMVSADRPLTCLYTPPGKMPWPR